MVSIVVPVSVNDDKLWRLVAMLKRQTVANEVLIIDSSSANGTLKVAASHGVVSVRIQPEEFDHGGTRSFAAGQAAGDVVLFLSQDAVPADDHAIEKLVGVLEENPEVGAVYGRQLPYVDATPFSAHLRHFNYSERSYVRSLEDRKFCGLKTTFFSNSFAAYRRSVLEQIGWFRENLIFGEDTLAAAEILAVGYKVAYVSDALVYHSHDYSALEEARRYFDIGVFHKQEAWIIEEFGRAEREGKRYLWSAFSYLKERGMIHRVPELMMRVALKLLFYKLGKSYERLPLRLARALSMNHDWWRKQARSMSTSRAEESSGDRFRRSPDHGGLADIRGSRRAVLNHRGAGPHDESEAVPVDRPE